jgi:dethiobiotin synthetase
MALRFVISGTDTGIGKTIFSAALTNALKAYYWKPIQSGLKGETDSEIVARLGCVPSKRIIPEVWKLNAPVSPHLAAQLDRVKINPQIPLPSLTKSPLVIEGAGGLLVPLTKDSLFADVFAQWQIPVILCARTGLGSINHTLLSLEAIRHRSIPLYGIVFIGTEEIDTQKIISTVGRVRILGRLPLLPSLTCDTLRYAFQEHFSVGIFHGVT